MFKTNKRNFLFEKIFTKAPNVSAFDLSRSHKTTYNMGELIPIYAKFTNPGERWQLACSQITRFLALQAPVQHNIDITFSAFWVRCQGQIFEEFDHAFYGFGDENSWKAASQLTRPEIPYLPFNILGKYSIGGYPNYKRNYLRLVDYLHMPKNYFYSASAAPTTKSEVKINTFKLFAYHKIYNDYFRDPNLSEAMQLPTTLTGELTKEKLDAELSNPLSLFQLHRVCYRKDAFTSALPEPQRGPDVLIPMTMEGNMEIDYNKQFVHSFSPGQTQASNGTVQHNMTNIVDGQTGWLKDEKGGRLDLNPEAFQINLQNATSSIRDLRLSNVLQKLFEKFGLGGGRKVEQAKSIYNMDLPNIYSNRCQFLGSVTMPVQISDVIQTSQSTSDSALGDFAGRAISAGAKMLVDNFTSPEHGVLMVMMYVRPQNGYCTQGIEPEDMIHDYYDFPIPDLEHIGEEAIKNCQLYFNPTDQSKNTGIFGYAPRYWSYKTSNDQVSGEFGETLEFWHLARKFTATPNLNQSFMNVKSDNRIFAVTDDDVDHLYSNINITCKALRPYSEYSTPMFL
nr:MAG: major capsid protein [Microviridae sp.]